MSDAIQSPDASLPVPGDTLQVVDCPPEGTAGQAPDGQPSGEGKPRGMDLGPHRLIDAADALCKLPGYTRSLLKIPVPVIVQLASKKQSIRQILALCPGSIISFEKTCDETLELFAGGCQIAAGEAVKVSDKFGLRILTMSMPDERFRKVVPNRPSREAR